ncbi:shisa family member 2a [Hypomesus transpacificus]|uniref:shisa family member 2a n=1 Tax=Hypomesus transpacificus TaxID=137520 RepID=UPI001F078D99|nr:shisa family member 2a [Hypomesus transpacificus]
MRILVALCFFAFMHGFADSSGEYCHEWADSYNFWHSGFQCPEKYDGPDAKYCCGTCALRYCCTAAEARLDQSSCVQETVLDRGNHEKNKEIAPKVPTYLPFLIVVSTFLSFVLIGTIVSICCCHCLKPKGQDHQNVSAPVQTGLLDAARMSPESMTPSRESSSSSTSTVRSTTLPREPNTFTLGSEVNMSMYAPLSNGYPVSGSQSNHYLHHAQPPGPFYQPYMNYGIPPEHPMPMAQNFVDNRPVYGPSLVRPIPQTHMHTEKLYTGVTI